MKPKQIIINILAVLFVFPLMGTFAQQAPTSGSIEVITTFDYPGTGNQTQPQKINERGDIVGIFVDSLGVSRGFVRFSDGSFSAPIVDPNDTVGFTEGRGINNSRTVCGDYATSDGNDHGFFLSGGTFTEYDVPGAVFTAVLGINNPADFAGTFVDASGIQQAFVSVGGTVTLFSVPGAPATLAYDINDSKQLVVGYYIDGSGILHGYYRDASGALHFPIDPPGSVQTILFGLNNRNFVVGRYADSLRRDSWTILCPAKQFFHFRFSRVNLYIAQRNQFAGEYHWSLRRCFRHCPRIHSSRQRHTTDKSGGAGNEGVRFTVAGHSSQRVARGVGRCNAGALS